MLTQEQLVPGTWVTVAGGGRIADLIHKFTHGPVAHAYYYVGPQPDGTDMVEMQPKGCRRAKASNYSFASSYPALRRLTPKQAEAGVALALDAASRKYPYSYLADFLLGARDGLGWKLIPTWVYRLAAIGHHMECSQFCDWIDLLVGWHDFDDGREPGQVTPNDLLRLHYHEVDGKWVPRPEWV